MDQAELLKFTTSTLERLGIPYAITGSQASIGYGEQRFTNDIDIVVEMNPAQLAQLPAAFPPDQFYISLDGARHAVQHGGQFNIIHQDSSIKVASSLHASHTGPTNSRGARNSPSPRGSTRGSSPPKT